nr:MAG TPA: hypothetical protein [Bacteriophage sp.]
MGGLFQQVGYSIGWIVPVREVVYWVGLFQQVGYSIGWIVPVRRLVYWVDCSSR